MTKISHGKKYNTYDLSGDFGIGYDSNGNKFFFDLEDYNLIKDICWYQNTKCYFVGHIVGDNRKQIKLHRFILGKQDGDNSLIVVDHVYSDRKYDNRKQNLRVTEQKYNTRNRIRPANNTSGKTGVSWRKDINRWVSYIGVNHKHIYLGTYKDIQDAVDVRIKAEKKYFGEYRVKNEH